MRWILASVGCLALANVVASPPAWADNPDEEKVVASEHYVAVVDGLDEGLIQRALAELKEHHPAVKAKADGGTLHIRSEDEKAFKAAVAALKALDVPMATTGAMHKETKYNKPLPSDKDVEQHIGALEKLLVAAREGGREQEVAKLEQALEDLRRQRKELAALRERGGDEKRPKRGDPRLDADALLGEQIERLEKQLGEAREGGREQEVAKLEHVLEGVRRQRKELAAMREKGGEDKHRQDDGELRERLAGVNADIGLLEKKLVEAREAGREREVEQFEQVLGRLRAQRKEWDGMLGKGGDERRLKRVEAHRDPIEGFGAKIERLEKRLVEAREAGREREVAELEQALEKMRAHRKELIAERERGEGGKRDKRDGERPDKAGHDRFEAKFEHIRMALAEAREAGREREVVELERALEQLRARREKAQADGEQRPNLDELRQRLEQAKRAVHQAEEARGQRMPRFEMDEDEEREIRRALEAMGVEMGRERDAKRRGPDAERPHHNLPLPQRMEHTRAALRHLKEAGLVDQAQQVERALHRMEMAQQGEARPQAPPLPPPAARQPHLVPAPAGPPRAFPPPMPMPAPECPPPSVGGVRRGEIQPRLGRQLYLPRPPGAQGFPPPAPVAVPRQARQARAFELEAPAGEGPTVLVGRESEWVVEKVEVGAGMKLSPPPEPPRVVGAQAAPQAVRIQLAPVPAGSERVEFPRANVSPDESARQIEQLRADLQQLKEMLKTLSKQLEAENR